MQWLLDADMTLDFFQVEISKQDFTLLQETSQLFATGLEIC